MAGLTKLKAVNRSRTCPSLSFCEKQPCPSLCVVHIGLIVSLCLRRVPSCAALQFANSEYVTGSGENHFPSFIFMTLRLTLVLLLPTKKKKKNWAILLSRKVIKRNKKIWRLESDRDAAPLAFFTSLVLASSWIATTRTRQILSNKSVSSVQFSSITQSCSTLCNPMNCSTPGLPVHQQLPEPTQNKSLSEYKKFKWKITLKERRLFLLIQ